MWYSHLLIQRTLETEVSDTDLTGMLKEQDSCTVIEGFQDKITLFLVSPLILKVLFKRWRKLFSSQFVICIGSVESA